MYKKILPLLVILSINCSETKIYSPPSTIKNPRSPEEIIYKTLEEKCNEGFSLNKKGFVCKRTVCEKNLVDNISCFYEETKIDFSDVKEIYCGEDIDLFLSRQRDLIFFLKPAGEKRLKNFFPPAKRDSQECGDFIRAFWAYAP